MLKLIAFVLLLQTTPLALANCKCGRKVASTRVVGGTIAPLDEYPWMVAIRTFTINKNLMMTISTCGGSIINSEHILSAAHCFVPKNGSEKYLSQTTYVAVGVNDISKLDTGKVFLHMIKSVFKNDKNVYKVDQIFTHEDYEPLRIKNDVAVLKVSRPFVFGPKALPVCLETENEFYSRIKLSGWGNIKTGVAGGNHLQEVTLNEIGTSECKWRWWDLEPLKQLCYESGERGACQGDSGGPLVVEKRGAAHQVGIVSFGSTKCESAAYPNVAARVSHYYPWITSKVKSGTWCEV